MFKRNLIHVWIGIIVLSCMFLMGQEPDWPTNPHIDHITPDTSEPITVVRIFGSRFTPDAIVTISGMPTGLVEESLTASRDGRS